MSIQIKSKQAILLVDDEDDIRAPIVSFLHKTMPDLMVVEASNGSEASQKINNQEFSCIVTDLNMPRAKGQDLIRNVKNSRLNRNTPILVLSAFPDNTLYALYDYLLILEKPIGISELVEHIKTQLTLGPLSQRISTFVFKNLNEVVISKVSSLNVDPGQSRTEVLRSGGEFPGEISIGVRINSNDDFNTLVIGFDSNFLGKAAEFLKMESKKEAAVVFSKKVAAELLVKGRKLSVEKSSLEGFRNLSELESSKIEPIRNKQRITTTIETSAGEVYCHAISGSPRIP